MTGKSSVNTNVHELITSKVIGEMPKGIRMLPSDFRISFDENDLEEFGRAFYLGIITYDEIEAAVLPPLDIRPNAWPSTSVTYVLEDGKIHLLNWLRWTTGGVSIFTFSQSASALNVNVPCKLTPDGVLRPAMQFVGASARVDGMGMNAARCALDGGVIMLARYSAGQQ